MTAPITHVLFDFFGTLVDYSASRTEQGYERSFALLRQAGSDLDYEGFLALWSRVASDFDAAADESLREFSMPELGRAFLREALGRPAPEGLVRDFVRVYVSEWNKGVRYPAGVPALLGRLAQRYTLAVITNTHDPDLVPDHLKGMAVSELFRDVVTSVEFGLRKPSPEIFQHTLRVLDAPAEGCIYVGDSFVADYRGARSAGLRAFLIDPLRAAPVRAGARLDSVLALEERLP